MLGSKKNCPNCNGDVFRKMCVCCYPIHPHSSRVRVKEANCLSLVWFARTTFSKVNRTIQCETCKLILEERCISDLAEYHAVTQTEEVHCVVAPDHLHNFLVDVRHRTHDFDRGGPLLESFFVPRT